MMKTEQTWEDLFNLAPENKKLQSRTCQIHDQNSQAPTNDLDELCLCGRLIRSHSFSGRSLKASKGPDWKPPEFRGGHSINVDVSIFGSIKPNNCKYVQLDHEYHMSVVYDLLVNDCGGENNRPDLILSVYGGAKYFIMTEKLEKEIIRGIIDAATTASKDLH